MNEIQIVEAPIEQGVSVQEVRGTLAAKFPEFRIAALIEDKVEGLWRARLVKSGEFPLKELGDEEETVEDSGADDVDDEEAPKKAPKPPSDDEDDLDKEEESDDEGGDSEEKGDPKGKAEHIIKQLEHLLPQLEELLGVGRGGEIGDLGEDVGPHMEGPPGHDSPMPEGVAPNGAGPSLPSGGPGAPPAPPRRPPGAGGGGRMRPGQIPTFTKRRSQLLEREANVSMKEAKAELEAEFPEYAVTELKKHRNRFLAKLELRST